MKNTPCGHAENVDGCGYCHLFHNVPIYAKKWSGEAKPVQKQAKCVHLGKATGELAKCGEGCGAGTQMKVYECAKYGRCTLGKKGVDVAGRCSPRCDGYSPEQVIETPQQDGIASSRDAAP